MPHGGMLHFISLAQRAAGYGSQIQALGWRACCSRKLCLPLPPCQQQALHDQPHCCFHRMLLSLPTPSCACSLQHYFEQVLPPTALGDCLHRSRLPSTASATAATAPATAAAAGNTAVNADVIFAANTAAIAPFVTLCMRLVLQLKAHLLVRLLQGLGCCAEQGGVPLHVRQA